MVQLGMMLVAVSPKDVECVEKCPTTCGGETATMEYVAISFNIGIYEEIIISTVGRKKDYKIQEGKGQ